MLPYAGLSAMHGKYGMFLLKEIDEKINEKTIKSSGISGIIRPGKTSIQIIVGTQVQFVADELKKLCK